MRPDGQPRSASQRPRLDLPYPLFGNPELRTNLFERQRFPAAIQAKTVDDNLLLSLVKPFEDFFDLRLPL